MQTSSAYPEPLLI